MSDYDVDPCPHLVGFVFFSLLALFLAFWAGFRAENGALHIVLLLCGACVLVFAALRLVA